MRHACSILALAAAGCGGTQFNGHSGDPAVTPITEVAIENDGADTISVTLTGAADEEVTFTDIAAGTTTDYEDIDDWSSFDLTVTVDAGTAQGGPISVDEDYLNVLVLSDATAPDLKSYESTGTGADPGGGNPGW